MDYYDNGSQESEALLLTLDKQIDYMTYYNKPQFDEVGRPVI